MTRRDRFIDSSGTRIWLSDSGPDSGFPVVLLHGWPDSSKLWRYQIPVLADAGYRVIAPDLRGFGRSDAPLGVDAFRTKHLIGDVMTVLTECGVEMCHLVGHDWGAALAWNIARRLPEILSSLTVLSVGHPNSFRAAGLSQREKSWYMLMFLHEGVAENWLAQDDYAGLREFTRGHPEAANWTDDLSRDGRLTASLNWYRANLPPEVLVLPPDDARPVAVDTMGVWSQDDVVLLEPQMTGSEQHVDGVWRYERLGGSHWIPVDVPRALNDLLLDWLSKNPVSTTPNNQN